jgi:hypothetical protein
MIGSLLARAARRAALAALLGLVFTACGARHPNVHLQNAAQSTHPVTSLDAAGRLLEGNGIGNITFGQPRSTVVARLERLLGPPHETIPGICGFGRSTDWIGLSIQQP